MPKTPAPGASERSPARTGDTPILAGELWEALGCLPEFEPTRPMTLPTGRALWRANREGLLALRLPAVEAEACHAEANRDTSDLAGERGDDD